MRKPPAGSRDGGELVRAPYFVDGAMRLYHGDALAVARELPSGAADCIVTSPLFLVARLWYGAMGGRGPWLRP